MDAGSIIWVVIVSVVAFFIFFSNLCIFVAVYKSKKLQNRGNIFILCLAGSDFLVSIFNIPFTAASIVNPSLRETGSTLCNVTGFFEMTFLIASVFSVTAINVHRYVYIVYWTKYYDIFKAKRIIIMISGLWISAILLSAPPLLNLSKISYKAGKSHCFVDWKVTIGYTFSLILICFLMPIVVMAFCYYRIYMFRRKSRKIMKNRLTKGGTPSSSNYALNEQKSKAPSTGNASAQPTDAKKEGNKTAKWIVEFLNESINETSEHIEMQNVSNARNENKQETEKPEDIKVENHNEFISDDELEGKESTVKKSDEAKGKKPRDSKIFGKKRRRSRMLSVEEKAVEQTFVDERTKTKKRIGLKKVYTGQKHKQDNDTNSQFLNRRVIEILVEESVTSNVDVQPPTGNKAEYKFQVCSSKVTENHEKYVVKRSKKKNKEERKLTMMCIIIVAAFFASWFPFVVTMLIESLSTVKIPTAVDKLTLLIGYLNSISNPIIYCYFNKNFRTQLKKIFCKQRMRKKAYFAKASRR